MADTEYRWCGKRGNVDFGHTWASSNSQLFTCSLSSLSLTPLTDLTADWPRLGYRPTGGPRYLRGCMERVCNQWRGVRGQMTPINLPGGQTWLTPDFSLSNVSFCSRCAFILLFKLHTKFGQLVLPNIVATRCHILRLKCTTFEFGSIGELTALPQIP